MNPLRTTLILMICGITGGILGSLCIQSCAPSPEAKTASSIAKAAIRIGDDVCQEVESAAGTTPEWATLLCSALDTADKVKVLLPRTEWHAIRARRGLGVKDGGSGLDTGPGL